MAAHAADPPAVVTYRFERRHADRRAVDRDGGPEGPVLVALLVFLIIGLGVGFALGYGVARLFAGL